jgi:hypothetical protein
VAGTRRDAALDADLEAFALKRRVLRAESGRDDDRLRAACNQVVYGSRTDVGRQPIGRVDKRAHRPQ